MKLRIGTRESKLALWQANHVRSLLEALGHEIDIVTIKTTGDKILDKPLSTVGGKGLFLKEIEDALLAKKIDLAVHSLKDVPAGLPDGLILDATLEREDPRDALVSRDRVGLAALADGARIGTSSLRRICQLRANRPGAHIEPLRGNVDTRLRKVQRGDVDAAILALAGLRRLGLAAEVAEVIDPAYCLPAGGQGAITIEVLEDRAGLCAQLNHPTTATCVRAERAFLAAVGGECSLPVAAYATHSAGKIRLEALIGKPDGTQIVRDKIDGSPKQAERLGALLARTLLDNGGRRILAEL